MKLKITKTYDKKDAANGYGVTLGNIKPITPLYHAEDFKFEIGTIEIGLFSFRDNKCSNFTLKTSNKTNEGLDIYFLLVGKTYEEIVDIVTKWLNN